MPETKGKARAGAAAPGSFMKSLFSGRLEAGLVFPYPRQDGESRETLRLVLESFRSWARERLDGGAIDRAAVFPETQVRELKELGILGLTIPEEYGGAGVFLTSSCRLLGESCPYIAPPWPLAGARPATGSNGILLLSNSARCNR